MIDITRRRRTRAAWALIGALLMAVFAPFLMIAAAMWMVDGTWAFEGRGLRYWLFVSGSRLERIGLVSPAANTIQYRVDLEEGNFPGTRAVSYASPTEPGAVMAYYEGQCGAMGYKITRRTRATGASLEAQPGEMLVCEIEPYLDVEVLTRRAPGETVTSVVVKVWGSE